MLIVASPGSLCTVSGHGTIFLLASNARIWPIILSFTLHVGPMSILRLSLQITVNLAYQSFQSLACLAVLACVFVFCSFEIFFLDPLPLFCSSSPA